MPGTHSALSRHLFTLDGAVLRSGGAKRLAKGQFTIVNSGKAGANGAVVVGDFAGLPKSTVLEMRLGKHSAPNSRTASNGKPYSSEHFTLNDIVDITANFPKFTEQKFDELIIGYDGINLDTQIDLEENQTTVLDIVLSGDHVGFVTGNCEHVIKVHFGKEVGETNEQVLEKVVKNLKSQTLVMGVPFTELVEVSLVNSENQPLGGTPYVFSTLTLTDGGDSNDLAKVQAQYPAFKVERESRSGLVSVYTILHPQATALAPYETVIPSYLKDCEDCAAGYDEIEGGFVYSVSVEDDGTDASTTVDNLPGFVAGSVFKKGQKDGVGTYTIVLSAILTDAQIATYTSVAGIQATAQISLIGDVKSVCYDDTVATTAWVAGETCYASVESYTIQLKDDECDGSRLADLQAYYPELVIEEGSASGQASRALTLTGTSGTANVVIDGQEYLATFATSLTVTATNFVTTHAADILANSGLTVTANAEVLTFTGAAEGFPAISIVNATTNLAGTLAPIDFIVTPSAGGCQRVYSTTVVTDIVCAECSDIFLQPFMAQAPEPYDFAEWQKVEPASNPDAAMGIKLKGRPFVFYPTDVSRDQIPFYETSTGIQVSGGYIEEVNSSFDPQFSDIFNVKRLSRKQDRDNLGGHLMQWEEASRAYFDGEVRHRDNLYARAVLGEESVLKYASQYVQYSITVHDSRYSQGVGRRSDMGTTYSIWAELGYHNDLEDYVNALAGRAGLEAVQALAR